MFGKIGSKVRSWRKYRETYDELMQLSNRELDDIGITRGGNSIHCPGITAGNEIAGSVLLPRIPRRAVG